MCFADCDLSYDQQDGPGDDLEPGCALGHISNLRNSILEHAKEKHPESFEVVLEEVIA